MGFSPLLKFDVPSKVDLARKKSSAVWVENYAESNIDVDGVPKVVTKLVATQKEYNTSFDTLVQKWQPQLDEKHSELEAYAKKAKTFKIKGLILAVVAVVVLELITTMVYGFIGILMGMDIDQTFVNIISLIVIADVPIPFIVYFILKRRKTKRWDALRSEYMSLKGEAEKEIRGVNEDFNRQCSNYYSTIDECYLDSLEPTQREIVLMRRQQEKQHQQLMREQQRMANEQREYQRRIEREQEQIRRDQQRLLEYEERRRRGY